jgi:N-acyl homoserine lactone hydrolase
LKALAAERGFDLIPGHDPVVWPALTRAMTQQFADHGARNHV